MKTAGIYFPLNNKRTQISTLGGGRWKIATFAVSTNECNVPSYLGLLHD